MNTTLKDKVLRKCKRLGKKNRVMRILMMAVIVVFMSIYNFVMLFSRNARKVTIMACAVLCFFINSSFNDAVEPGMDEILPEASLGIESIALSDKIYSEELLDDNDVIDEFEDDVNIYYDEEVDTFSVDEILEDEIADADDTEYQEESSASENSYHSESALIDDEKKQEILKQYDQYDFSEDDWRYVLINKQHPIPDDYSFTLGTIKGSMQCDERIIESLIAMLQAAKEDGVTLVVCSPYRDYNKQKVLFERKINRYMAKGYSYLEAYKLASQSVTVPGASEHQIGLAIDFISNNYKSLNDGFGLCDAGLWLREHSYEYGFILRYPKGKEDITGISYEPWHFRYVGIEAATVITLNDITLEEFTEDYLE